MRTRRRGWSLVRRRAGKLGFYVIGWGVSRILGLGEQGECGGGLGMV